MNEPNKSQREVEREGVAHRGAVKTRILILGGGFAGVRLFTRMVHEVIDSDLEPADICNPLRKLLRRVTILTGEVKATDLAARRVTISYGLRELKRELPFDDLVLALGSETSDFGIPGVAGGGWWQ